MDASLGLARSTPDQRMFRARLGRYFQQSELLRRCLEKPRGYAGDYLMMEGVCGRAPAARNALGSWLDSWFLGHFPPFIAVRNRRDMIASALVEEYARGARRILNVACGATPELAACIRKAPFDEIVLLDQDAEALAFAKSRLQGEEGSTRSRVECIASPVQPLMKSAQLLEPGQFDVVYSMGLYDYLSTSRGRALTANLWSVLRPGGLLIIGNFQGHHWARYVMEAVMDWFLVYRDEDDMLGLAARVDGAEAQLQTDSTGLLYLLRLRKRRT
jgi:SAM-dependent methyltransferase